MTRTFSQIAAALLLIGCGPDSEGNGTTLGTGTGGPGAGDPGSTGIGGTTNTEPCGDYPAGAVEPMALNEVLWPYRWDDGRHRDGRIAPIDLERVFCNGTTNFEVLLFVSIPAW